MTIYLKILISPLPILSHQHNLLYVTIMSLWKRTCLLIWTNLNLPYQRMLSVKFAWIWLLGSQEKMIFKDSKCIFTMSQLFPFRQGHGHSLNFFYPRMSFGKIGLKMAQWIWITLVDQKKPNQQKTNKKQTELLKDFI